MAAQAFLNDAGEVILNQDGSVMYDETCCCEGTCTLCGVQSDTLQVEYDVNLNWRGSCNDFVGTWDCSQLSPHALAALMAEFPHGDWAGASAPCAYATTTGLPCGCLCLAVFFAGADQWSILMIWPEEYVRLNINFRCDGAGSAVALPSSGLEGGSTIADFLQLYVNAALWSNVILNML